VNIDIAIFAIFLCINLVVGLYYGRNVKSLRDYALGSPKFPISTFLIAVSIAATWISGSAFTIGLVAAYSNGLYELLPLAGMIIRPLLVSQFLAIRMGEFLGKLSIAEAMGNLYGSTLRTITAVTSIVRLIVYVSIQFKVSAMVLSTFLGFPSNYAVVLTALIIAAYAAFGGIRSIMVTDLVQLVTFSIFVPVLALVIWSGLKDPAQVYNTLTTNPIFSFSNLFSSPKKGMLVFLFFVYCSIPSMSACPFQRVAISKNVYQVRKTFLHASWIVGFLVYSISWIGILLLSQDSMMIQGNFKSVLSQLLSRITHICCTYKGLKGLVATGIMAMVMSTVDSDMNSASVIFAHDIARYFKLNKKVSSLLLARIFVFIFSGFALVLAFYPSNDFLHTISLIFALYVSTITVPFILAIFGFRSKTSRPILIGIVGGISAVVFWRLFMEKATGIKSVIAGMLANLICLLVSHYLLKEKGGWVGIKEPGPLVVQQQARKQFWNRLFRGVKNFSLYRHLRKNAPKEAHQYTLFGLYVLFSTYVSFYFTSNALQYETLYSFIVWSTLVLTSIFLVYPILPATIRKKWIITIYWSLVSFYILFVVSPLLAIMTKWDAIPIMLFLLNALIAALIVSWPRLLLMSLLGPCVAVWLFKAFTGQGSLPESLYNVPYKLVYIGLLFNSLLVALFRIRSKQNKLQDYNQYLRDTHDATSQHLVEALQHQERFAQMLDTDAILAIGNLAKQQAVFDRAYKQSISLEEGQTINQERAKLTQKLQAAHQYFNDLMYQTKDHLILDVQTITLQELKSKWIETLEKHFTDTLPRTVFHTNTTHTSLQCDTSKVNKLLITSLALIQEKNTANKPIAIHLQDAWLAYKGNVPRYTKKVNALQIILTTTEGRKYTEKVFKGNDGKSKILPPSNTEDLLLQQNARIVDAHYGYIHIDAEGKDITYTYVLPINIHDIRPKEMDEIPVRTISPIAIPKEEKAFIEAIRYKKSIDISKILEAIAFIKKHHAHQTRKSGEPFYLHPVSVAHILLDYTKDQNMLIAALLHDVVEDNKMPIAQIGLLFGSQVQSMVDQVTHLKNGAKKSKLSSHEKINKLVKAGGDHKALQIKLADRLHNIRTLKHHKDKVKQQKIAQETLQIYVPLGNMVGMKKLTEELQELANRFL